MAIDGRKEARNLRNRVIHSSDLRKLENRLRNEGYNVTTEKDLGSFWTKVKNTSTGTIIDFDYTVGRDEYDDKETHLGSVRW